MRLKGKTANEQNCPKWGSAIHIKPPEWIEEEIQTVANFRTVLMPQTVAVLQLSRPEQ
jgi:hypothetical protein